MTILTNIFNFSDENLGRQTSLSFADREIKFTRPDGETRKPDGKKPEASVYTDGETRKPEADVYIYGKKTMLMSIFMRKKQMLMMAIKKQKRVISVLPLTAHLQPSIMETLNDTRASFITQLITKTKRNRTCIKTLAKKTLKFKPQ